MNVLATLDPTWARHGHDMDTTLWTLWHLSMAALIELSQEIHWTVSEGLMNYSNSLSSLRNVSIKRDGEIDFRIRILSDKSLAMEESSLKFLLRGEQ